MGIAFPGESTGVPGGARSTARAGDRAAPRDGGGRRRQARAPARGSRPGGLRLPGGRSGRHPDRREAVGAVRARQGLAGRSTASCSRATPATSGRGPRAGETALLPLEEGPCPSCVALLDQLDGAAEHASQQHQPRGRREVPAAAHPHLRRGAGLAAAAAAVLGRQHLQPRLSRRDRRGGTEADAERVPPRRRRRSATSGARSSSTRRPTPDRIPATSAPSSRSGTCSTSPRRDARPTGTSS